MQKCGSSLVWTTSSPEERTDLQPKGTYEGDLIQQCCPILQSQRYVPWHVSTYRGQPGGRLELISNTQAWIPRHIDSVGNRVGIAVALPDLHHHSDSKVPLRPPPDIRTKGTVPKWCRRRSQHSPVLTRRGGKVPRSTLTILTCHEKSRRHGSLVLSIRVEGFACTVLVAIYPHQS